jgi:hypothetical protein
MTRVLVGVALLGLAGCAAIAPAPEQALVSAGEVLLDLERSYARTHALYEQLWAAQAISREEYAQWAAFAREFRRTYPRAVALWETATVAEDARRLEEFLSVLQQHIVEHALRASRRKEMKP